MSDSTTVQLGGEAYVVQPGDGMLTIGRPTGDGVTWLDAVDLALLSAPARAAIERGEWSDGALQVALLGVVRAEVDRGA
jgi:hypothetical protein